MHQKLAIKQSPLYQLAVYLFPAVIFDIVQHVSFLMESLVADSKHSNAGRTEQLRTTYKQIMC